MKIIEPYFEFIDEPDPLKKIELCGRVCYKSESKITADSAETFVKNLIRRGHESVLEHAVFVVTCDDRDAGTFNRICNTIEHREEVNHPKRYAGGKYECIDVMTDVFGVDAVRNFCKLNAFKYIWREQNKNGVEDIKKAVWYLNKLIELSENANENV